MAPDAALLRLVLTRVASVAVAVPKMPAPDDDQAPSRR